jgi:hypothetical protein
MRRLAVCSVVIVVAFLVRTTLGLNPPCDSAPVLCEYWEDNQYCCHSAEHYRAGPSGSTVVDSGVGGCGDAWEKLHPESLCDIPTDYTCNWHPISQDCAQE